jgi:6,7-dimethyl-8-ribityllumazine synthase
MHFEYICEAVSQGIMRLNLDNRQNIPVIFGVLAVLNLDQARARAGLGENSHNHGIEWAQSAVKMARFPKALLHSSESITSII